MSFKKMYLVPITDNNYAMKSKMADDKTQNQIIEAQQNAGQVPNLDTSSSSSTNNENIFDSRLKNIVNSNLNESEKLEIVKSIISLYDKKNRKHKQTKTQTRKVIPISRKKISPEKHKRKKAKSKKNRGKRNGGFDKDTAKNDSEEEIDLEGNESLTKLSTWTQY